MKKLLDTLVKYKSLCYKVFALLVTVTLILLMFPSQRQAVHYDYAVGGFWQNSDLIAPYDFAVLKTQDERDQETATAKSKSLLYYTADSTAHAKALGNLYRKSAGLSVAQQNRLHKTIDSIYKKGYIEVPADIPDIANHTLVLLAGNIGSEHTAEEFVTPYDIDDAFLRDSVLCPSIVFDDRRTQLELESRLSQIGYNSLHVSQGELLIAKGEYVTEEKVQMLRSFEAEEQARFEGRYNHTAHFVGQFLLCIIAFVTLYLFLKNTQHRILDDDKKVTFVFIIVLLIAAATAMVVRINPDWVLIVPLCIVPILMRIFFDMRVALYIHITTIIIIGNLVPNSFEFIYYQLMTGMMSIISVRNFENRSKFFLVSLIIFVTYSLIYTAGILSQDTNLANLNTERYLMFFLNAVLTLLAYPMIYLFEKLFSMTTNLTLMEISSTNTPALRELSRKAPGTFQHAMQVANLSEDIISEIGGNAMLAKVGALYHDIGKTLSPEYFTENQNSDFNPHDELDYDESARLIIQHVTDGIALARRYHLPNEVIDFIRTHHGTTHTGYFYAKYKNEHPNETIDASAFRYPGPAPYSRETAVVMIADSVEAACKSLKQPDREKINQLVDSVIDGKIRENQLQNCNITFSDVAKIRQFLKMKMQSVYHVRIAYPTMGKEATANAKN